ncbi:MAG: DNA topoisomerase III [Chthoniobacterales bacterium]|nr:DNA topoisomerase III [Chthoniobacterales bacterium]
MSKTLVIAEKPSVAGDLARALGKFKKEKGYYEGDSMVISHTVGHLLEIQEPDEFKVVRGKWSLENLPVLPNRFDLVPREKAQEQLRILKKLLARKDVGEVINACDAGREGELIFRYVVQHFKNTKPIKRLWLQSMTADAIREGFAHLRSDEEMIPLSEAATCRSESDWLVGINGSRAMTAFYKELLGGFQVTPVGRVQTPTLAILVEREEKIRNFQPRPYFELHGEFGVAAGAYIGKWFDEKFKKSSDEDAKAERIWGRAKADEIKAKCEGKTGTVEETKTPKSESSPLLYDLTTLQREANGRFGFSAKRTLQIAQALYEKHKVLTYPRTDSRYLPQDNLPAVKKVLSGMDDPSLGPHARKALDKGWVTATPRVFNNAKVSDHHAIIPTGASPEKLDEYEMRLYDLVARRFIAVFFPPAKYEVTKRITTVEGEKFKTDGKVLIEPGWREVYGKSAAGADEESLVPVKQGETAETKSIEVKELQTKPAPRFTEATLLSAMEGAGKLVEDEELREAMSQRGLGTPATRAAIIEGLLTQEYVRREGRDLAATAKGIKLITALRELQIGTLSSPEMTGEWEYKLKQIEAGQLKRDAFMEEIRGLVDRVIKKIKEASGQVNSETMRGNFHDLDAKCPKCGSAAGFKESFKAYDCKAGCGLVVWKTVSGRELEPEEVRALLDTGSVGPIKGFKSKMGRPFEAKLALSEATGWKTTFDFGDGGVRNNEPFNKDAATMVVEKCPVCENGAIYDAGNAFACEHALAPEKKCAFRMGKTILQREISADDVRKICAEGKTALLTKFISKKGRPFNAFLVLDKKSGKVGFEFEERKPKTPKKTAAAAGAS